MSAPNESPQLNEYKIRASRLLKAWRGDDQPQALAAAERLRIVPRYRAMSAAQILAGRESLQLKHALQVVALEAGRPDWLTLKRSLDDNPWEADADLFYPQHYGAFLNHWCKTYEEARALLERQGGYLLPYRKQYFICQADFIKAIGLDPADPDWERIGHDWIRPDDQHARDRLWAKLRANR